MRILVATGLYPPDIGGPATHTVFLETHLSKFGIIPTVLPYASVRQYPKFLRHGAYILKLLFASRGHDGIYALDTISVGVPGMIASYLTLKPLILRVPGDYAWEQGQQRFGIMDTLDEFLLEKKQRWQVRVLQWLQKRVAQKAVSIIVPSDYMKRVVEKWGIESSKITRVYTELKEIVVAESKEELRSHYHYEGFVVTTVARLVPWKGVRVLIQAIHTLHMEGIPVTLTIVGDGVLRQELEELVISLTAHEYVHFTGSVSHHEVGRRIKASDVFVLNTSYEGMSHNLLEALSLGTPIVTTPVGGNVELIDHENTGLLMPYNDHTSLVSTLERLYHNPNLGTTLAQHGVGVLARFREGAAIEEIVRVLKKSCT